MSLGEDDKELGPYTLEPGRGVTLPLGHDQFRDFISSLLGKPESRSWHRDFPFDLTLDFIVDLDALITQRVGQHLEGGVVSFTATVQLQDSTSTRLSHIAALQTYRVLSDATVTGIDLQWDVLLRFGGREAPEKQRIVVAFRVGTAPRNGSNISLIFQGMPARGQVEFSVDYTDRSWGADLENLLAQTLIKSRARVSPVLEWIGRRGSLLFPPATLLVAFITIIAAGADYHANASTFLANNFTKNLLPIRNVPTQASLEAHYVFLKEANVVDGAVISIILFAMVGLMTFMVSFAIVLSLSRRPRFILLSEASVRRHARTISIYGKSWWFVIGGLVVPIFCSLAASYIFVSLHR